MTKPRDGESSGGGRGWGGLGNTSQATSGCNNRCPTLGPHTTPTLQQGTLATPTPPPTATTSPSSGFTSPQCLLVQRGGVGEAAMVLWTRTGPGRLQLSLGQASLQHRLAPLSTITSPATLSRTFQCCTINKYSCILLPNYCIPS